MKTKVRTPMQIKKHNHYLKNKEAYKQHSRSWAKNNPKKKQEVSEPCFDWRDYNGDIFICSTDY